MVGPSFTIYSLQTRVKSSGRRELPTLNLMDRLKASACSVKGFPSSLSSSVLECR